MSTQPRHPSASGPPPLAVLYLPPILNVHADEDELATLGRKLALSLDKFATNKAAIYESHLTTVTVRDREERACRLTRAVGATGPAEPLADVFLVDYRPVLMERYRKAGLGQKVILAALGLGVMLGKGVLALGRQPFKVKRLRDRCQALYVLACFSVVFAYLALLLVTAVAVVHNTLDRAKRGDQVPQATNAPAAGALTNHAMLDFGPAWPVLPVVPQGPGAQTWRTPPGVGEPLFPPAALPLWLTNGSGPGTVWEFGSGEPENHTVSGWLGESASGVWDLVTAPVHFVWDLDAADAGLLLLVLAALGFAGGQGKENRLREFINRASEEMLAFIYYLSFTDRRAEVTGLVDARLEEIMEPGTYARHVVMGFSFGTVVALDAFCPASDVRARRLEQVDTLVTIGAPYDFILTYWPRYFADRQHQPPRKWLNVYSPVDLLGTCFNKEKARQERAQRLRAANQPAPPVGRAELQNSFGHADQLATGPTQEFAFREGIPDEQLGIFGWIAMQGLGAHSRYWAKGEDGERNCFDLLVAGVFPDEFAPPTADASAAAAQPTAKSSDGLG